MSAFVVSDNHIDALVTVAIFGVSGRTATSGMWCGPYVFNNRASVYSADRLGAMLLNENVLSVQARYPNDSVQVTKYTYPLGNTTPYMSAVAALKLVKCYEYQACEHDGWDTSDAKKFCAALTGALIDALPGYDAAPWALD